MEAKIDAKQEKMEAAIHSIRSNVPSCVDQKMQGLGKELTNKIDKIQVDLQEVKGNIMDTKKNFY
jgi:rRNA-processing protein FCF1